MTDATESATAGTSAADTAGTRTATATTNDSWTANFTNPEIKGFAELRGWKDPEAAVESFRNLEKLQGVPAERLAKIPEAGDTAGWAEFNKKFGWSAPEKATDYELTKLEGFDPGFAEAAQGIFHKHGLPKDKALGAMTEIGAILKQIETDTETARVNAHNGDVEKLKSEWGANYDGLIETGKRAQAEYMTKMGLADADMDAMRDAVGTAKFNKFWAGIGSTMGEAAFVQSDSVKPVNGLMTPDAAKVRLTQLGQDREWFARKEAGGVKENQEYKTLRDIVANATLSASR